VATYYNNLWGGDTVTCTSSTGGNVEFECTYETTDDDEGGAGSTHGGGGMSPGMIGMVVAFSLIVLCRCHYVCNASANRAIAREDAAAARRKKTTTRTPYRPPQPASPSPHVAMQNLPQSNPVAPPASGRCTSCGAQCAGPFCSGCGAKQ
jgi:hypothetical protein